MTELLTNSSHHALIHKLAQLPNVDTLPGRKDLLRMARANRRSSGFYPTIDAIPETAIGRKQVFSGLRIMAVPHFCPSAVAFVRAQIKMGAAPERISVFLKDYAYRDGRKVRAMLNSLGVRVVPLEQKDAELSRVKAELVLTGGRLVVYDDGAEIIPEILADEFLSERMIGAVEQTTRGRNRLRLLSIQQPVLSLPDSTFKATFECGAVGQAAMDALNWHLGGRHDGKRITVLGAAGVIGLAFAKEAAARGSRVCGFDPAPKDPYFALNTFRFMNVCATKPQALKGADVVVGATGCTSLSHDDLLFLEDGAILASISSGQVEFPIEEIKRLADEVQPFRAADHREPHGTTYKMKWGRALTVLDGGRPLNLGIAGPPEDPCFDLVMSVLLVGLAEIAAGEFAGQSGLLNVFDNLIQRHDLADLYMALHSNKEAA